MKFLHAAYLAVWIIHFSYLTILGRGYRRVKAEMREVDKSGS